MLTKNNSDIRLTDGEIQIGDFRTVASVFWPKRIINESYSNRVINLSEKSPIMLSLKFKYNDKILTDKIDITSKLIPFEGKSIILKFEINPEGNPIINNLVITEAKY